MSIQIVFETHSITEDNENSIATGWLDGRLSERGRAAARALGARRANDGIQAVFASDLGRAVETVRIAFEGQPQPIFLDWRLRECDYGRLNGHPRSEVHANRLRYLEQPYPEGESWQQAVARVGRFLPDLRLRWENSHCEYRHGNFCRGKNCRVLVIGHIATRFAFEHLLKKTPLEDLLQSEGSWQEGWEYELP